MTIIQYYGTRWDKELTYMFAKVVSGRVIRFEHDRGDIIGFDKEFTYNKMVIE